MSKEKINEMLPKEQRLGQVGINNQGLKMTIIKYKNSKKRFLPVVRRLCLPYLVLPRLTDIVIIQRRLRINVRLRHPYHHRSRR